MPQSVARAVRLVAAIALASACGGGSNTASAPPAAGSGSAGAGSASVTAGSGSSAGSGSAAATPDTWGATRTDANTKPAAPLDLHIKTTNADGTMAIDPALVTGKLPNGLTYYIRKNAKPEKRAALWLAVNAGSVLEDDDQRGLAHFCEHMAFNGTKKYAKQEIVDWLEKIGMKFGADVNAGTSWDETVYQLEVPTEDPAFLAHGLDVLHEWAHSVTFAPDRVDKERGIILEERRLGRGAQGRLLDQIVPAALPGSKYGQRIPIGLPNIIQTATPETLKRFYNDWYRPDLMAVIVVGDVDPPAIVQAITEQFGDLQNPANERPRTLATIDPQPAPIALSLTDAELPISIVAIADKVAPSVAHSDAEAAKFLPDLLLDQVLTERLEAIGQRGDAPFAQAGVQRLPILRAKDIEAAFAVVKDDKTAETVAALSTELSRVAKFGVQDSELARAKTDLLQRLEVDAKEQDTEESAKIVEELVKSFLTTDTYTSSLQTYVIMKRLLPAVTAADLQAAAAARAAAKDAVIIAAGNAKSKQPAGPALTAAFTAGAAKATTAWEDDAATGPLVATPPKPGEIKATREIKELGVTEWTLANGITVVLKPTDFQKDHVVAIASWPGGTSLAADADFIAADNADEIAAVSGVGTLSAVQLAKALKGTSVDVGLTFDRDGASLTGGAPSDHLEQLFQLMYLRLQPIRDDHSAVEAWRAQEVATRKNVLSDPRTVFEAKFREAMAGHNPRARLLTSDDFAKLPVDRALAFYRDRLAHLGGMKVVIVGDFTLDAIKPFVLAYLGGIQAGPAEAFKDLHMVPPAGAVKFEVKQGIEPKATVHLVFHTAAAHSFDGEHQLRALGEALAISLREKLREGMSGTYGVLVRGYFDREPTSVADLEIEFGCAPENIDSLTKAMTDILAQYKASGPPPEVVAKVQQTERRELETGMKTNDLWFGALYSSYRYGDDPKYLLEVPKRIDATTVDSLKAAANQFIGNDSVMGVLRPAK